MPIHGTLASMAMPELLQWVGESRKSGCLQIEHDGSRTSLAVTSVVATSYGRVMAHRHHMNETRPVIDSLHAPCKISGCGCVSYA